MLRCASFVLLLAGSLGAQGALIVVDAAGGPGSHATQIADAVALAADGDTILVRSGEYIPFVVDGRALVITAAPGASVTITSSAQSEWAFEVRHVAPQQVVVIAGLSNTWTHGALVHDCGGQVWLQDCHLLGQVLDGGPALRVSVSDAVMLVRSSLAGSFFWTEPDGPGFGSGLHAVASRVFVHDSTLTGGRSAEPPSLFPQSGPGAAIEGGLLVLEGSSVTGGEGGGQFDPGLGLCLPIKTGDGLQLASAATAISLDTSIQDGGCFPGADCCTHGDDVEVGPGSSYQPLPGPSANFTLASPLPDGQPATLDVSGAPGDLPLLLVATSLGPVNWFAKYSGALVAGSPFLLLLAPIPAGGTLAVPFGFPDALPPGTGSTVFLQGAVFKATGGGLLSDPFTLTTFEE